MQKTMNDGNRKENAENNGEKEGKGRERMKSLRSQSKLLSCDHKKSLYHVYTI